MQTLEVSQLRKHFVIANLLPMVLYLESVRHMGAHGGTFWFVP